MRAYIKKIRNASIGLGMVALAAGTANAQCLSGTYTIGGTSPNYTSVAAAVADLNAKVVCGAVTFDVRSGTYSARVVINAVAGASSTNTITFLGAGAANTIITFTGTTSGNRQTILLDGADYITFKDMTIENKGTTQAVAIGFTGSADYNTVENCKIRVSTTSTSSNVLAVNASGSATSPTANGISGNFNLFKDNTIEGGLYGIYWRGLSTGPGGYVEGNRFINNTISDYYQYGIYIYYHRNSVIHSNSIGTTRLASAYGLYNHYGNNYTVTANEINVGGFGMHIGYTNNFNPTGKRALIANNIINASGSQTGLYLLNPMDADIHHNSIRTNAGFYTSQVMNATGLDVRNNIFENTTRSNGYAFYTNNSSYAYLDYNIYYAPASSNLIYYNFAYQSLGAVQLALPQYNENSLSQDPQFISTSDIHVVKNIALPFGPELGYTLDVDGDVRCRYAPTIGADESSVGKDQKPVAGIAGPDTIFVNSPTEFLGNMTAGVPHTNLWYIDGVLLKDSANFLATIPSTGTYTIKVVAQGCQKKDSTTKKVVVVVPTKPPVVQFVADKINIAPNDKVSFTELTSGGATSLSWEISPGTGVDEYSNVIPAYEYTFGDTSYRMPTVQFLSGGSYKVCLTARNSVGSTTVCKSNYVRVVPAYSMSGAIAEKMYFDSAGIFFDPGGQKGNYGNNFNGTALLDPCAEEVYLTFKSFDVECGSDVLYIYDGEDASGKPLHKCAGGYTGGGSCGTSCAPILKDTIVAKSGKMFLQFQSNSATNAPGFEAHWWSKPKKTPAPIASIEGPDKVCVDNIVMFQSTTKGESLRYFWDFDGDFSSFEGFSRNAHFSFFTTGKHTITLIAVNCGGIDTITKDITVFTPTAPSVAFTTNNIRPTTKDIVIFSPDIKECVDDYKWSFKASVGSGKAVFVNGTNRAFAHPQVMFSDTGCYTVQLFAKNAGGEDSLALNCYVRVKQPYCVPSVDKNIPDIGISQVDLFDMTNPSSQAVSDYENFIESKTIILEDRVTYTLAVKRNSNVNAATRTAWIDWNHDGDFLDSGEKIGEEKNSTKMNWAIQFTVPSNASKGATLLRVAINHGSLDNTPCGPNKYGEFEDYRIYVTPDNTLPVITLLDEDTVYVEQGYTYTEAGATAEDNLDGNITNKIKKVNIPTFDNMIPGIYNVHFDVQDMAGNQAERVTRIVIVTTDATPPLLIVEGDDTAEVAVFTSGFTLPNVLLAEDLVDGDLSSSPGPAINGTVDVNVLGTYVVTYSISDAGNNKAVVTRTFIVIDTIAPVLTLNGDNPVDHEVMTPYTDAGVTFTDNYYQASDLQPRLDIVNPVNENKTGTYIIAYRLTDLSGNVAAEITRTVIVSDSTAPQIIMSGEDTVVLEVNSVFSEPKKGTTATDTYDGSITVSKGGSFYSKFTDGKATELGLYTIEYTAVDAAGNKATRNRVVNVVDTEAPVITLKGDANANICRWDNYTDAGYEVSDNYTNPSNTITINQQGNFTGTAKGGVYTLWYEATDISGNSSRSQTRYIYVNADPYACGRSTGIGEDVNLEQHISIYPNPTSGMFKVSLDLPQAEQMKIKVLNLMGQEVAEVAEGSIRAGLYEVDLANHASGVYVLSVITDTQHYVKRIVVNK